MVNLSSALLWPAVVGLGLTTAMGVTAELRRGYVRGWSLPSTDSGRWEKQWSAGEVVVLLR